MTERFSAPQTFSADWLTPGRFAALLALVLFVMFPDVFLGTKTFFHHDFTVFGYPLAYFQRESFWRGEMPFWNPLNNCGLPFMAQWNTLTFYPGSLIYLLLPLPWSLCIFTLTHLFLAGMGMYFLAFRWTENRLASGVAGLGFAFSGLAQCSLIWPNNVASIGLMPWVILANERAVQNGGRNIGIAGLLAGIQLLSGAPEMIIFTWLISGVLFLKQVLQAKTSFKTGSRFVSVLILAIALASVQLLPFLDLLRHSQRHSGYSDTADSIPGSGWANFIIPLFNCFKSRYGVYFQQSQNWTTSYYAGIGILFFAILAFWTKRRRECWIFGAISILALLMGMGDATFVYPSLRKLLPQLGYINFPVKFIVLTIFCLPLLAAFAVAETEKDQGLKLRPAIFIASTLVLFAAAIVFFEKNFSAAPIRWQTTAWNALTRTAFLLATIAAFYFSRRVSVERTRLLLQVGFLLLLAFDLWTYGPQQTPRIEPGILKSGLEHPDFSPAPKLGESRVWIDRETHYKVGLAKLSDTTSQILVLRLMLHLDCNLLDKIPKGNGFFSLYLRDFDDLKMLADVTAPTNAPGLFDFLSVSYIPKETELGFRKREGFLPMITGGQRPVFANRDETFARIFSREFDPRKTVYLPLGTKLRSDITNETTVRIVKTRFLKNAMEVEAESGGPALLTFSQAFYHPWRAFVDGEKAPLLKANYAFQAVEIPAGKHQVRLVYDDKLFVVGMWISLAGLGLCAGLAASGRKRSAY